MEVTEREPHTRIYMRGSGKARMDVDHLGTVRISEELLDRLLIESGWTESPAGSTPKGGNRDD